MNELRLKQKPVTAWESRHQASLPIPGVVTNSPHDLKQPSLLPILTTHKKITCIYFPNLEASINQIMVSRENVIQLCGGNTYSYLLSQKNPLLKKGILSFCNNFYQFSVQDFCLKSQGLATSPEWINWNHFIYFMSLPLGFLNLSSYYNCTYQVVCNKTAERLERTFYCVTKLHVSFHWYFQK